MKANTNMCPADLASVEFFQFLKMPEGRDLYDMFTVIEQPSEALWNHYHTWWSDNKQVWDEKFNPRGILDPSWARFVAWTSKAFMRIFMDILTIMTMNPSLMNGEQLLWQTTLLKNFILDLKLATSADSVRPSTWFQRLVALRKYFCLKNGHKNMNLKVLN